MSHIKNFKKNLAVLFLALSLIGVFGFLPFLGVEAAVTQQEVNQMVDDIIRGRGGEPSTIDPQERLRIENSLIDYGIDIHGSIVSSEARDRAASGIPGFIDQLGSIINSIVPLLIGLAVFL